MCFSISGILPHTNRNGVFPSKNDVSVSGTATGTGTVFERPFVHYAKHANIPYLAPLSQAKHKILCFEAFPVESFSIFAAKKFLKIFPEIRNIFHLTLEIREKRAQKPEKAPKSRIQSPYYNKVAALSCMQKAVPIHARTVRFLCRKSCKSPAADICGHEWAWLFGLQIRMQPGK